MKKLFTSESVTEGHPDKVCDRISDAILDEVLNEDPTGRVACETCITTGIVFITGEISTTAHLDIDRIARRTLRGIGYDSEESGFDANTCAIITSIKEQSRDISMGTNDRVGGAGDQGMMFGYACNETPELMPLPIMLAHKLAYQLALVRKNRDIPFLLPDGKTQVTVEYDDAGRPVRIDTILISTQHSERVEAAELEEPLVTYVINPVLKELHENSPQIDIDTYNLLINPTGRFVIGGPAADAGLTGRKIIVDTYGGYAPHGGGAFSGKDPTKVDRSGAYLARKIAKNIVAADICNKCQVQLAYAIGMTQPVSVRIDTFDSRVNEERLIQAVEKCFDMTPQEIIERMNLRRPIYEETSAYGHFGCVTGTVPRGKKPTWLICSVTTTTRCKEQGELLPPQGEAAQPGMRGVLIWNQKKRMSSSPRSSCRRLWSLHLPRQWSPTRKSSTRPNVKQSGNVRKPGRRICTTPESCWRTTGALWNTARRQYTMPLR